ncbi:MAG: hypothetical protein Q9186_004296 [Xanthomendoza sp. 1 TL-2023]
MADPTSISLRAWPSEDKVTQSLPYLIARINEQRGSFRNVTEASLQEEIRAIEAGDQSDLTDKDDDITEDEQNAQADGERLFKARQEIIKQVGEAYNTSAQALDLVSLLLSSHNPKAAEATVSPYIKQIIPLGSLGAEIMEANPQPSTETDDLVGLGWRMDSLSRGADSLLTSAKRLEQEMERENTYWEQVLAVKAAGWPICRIPGERQTLGVRFGFAEGIITGHTSFQNRRANQMAAHAEYRDRGLAALRRNVDGNIKLDRGQRWHGDKQLRVQILKVGQETSTMESSVPMDEQLSVSQQLLRARNSLFDEELFHELSREARNLVNQQVRCVNGNIYFPYKDGSQVEISLADTGEDESVEIPSATVPATIATTLRILLSHAHRQNLQRRSLPPPPLTDTSTARPLYSLLRPILEVIQHQSLWTATQAFFDNLSITHSTSKVSVQVTSSSLDLSSSPDGMKSNKSTAQKLLDRLVSAQHSRLKIRLPMAQIILDLAIHTSIFPPTFGTSFHLSTISSPPDSAIAEMPPVITFPTLESLQKHVKYIISLGTSTGGKQIATRDASTHLS